MKDNIDTISGKIKRVEKKLAELQRKEVRLFGFIQIGGEVNHDKT